MGKIEGIFVYDIDDLQAVAAAHLAERSRQAGDAEMLIAGEVERFHLRQRIVNAAPAIMALQKQAEETRQAELRRLQSRLEGLTAEQQAAVEALTRGLMNKLLHPPMQALKQAAREDNQIRIDALCAAWQLDVDSSADASRESSPAAPAPAAGTPGSTVMPIRSSSVTKVDEKANDKVGEPVVQAEVETH
jgi:glutamyl-tRNA reductase